MGAELTVGAADISFWSGKATLENVSLHGPDMDVRIGRVVIETSPLRHLRGGRDIDSCAIEDLDARLVRPHQADTPRPQPAEFRIGVLTVRDGTIEITDPRRDRPPAPCTCAISSSRAHASTIAIRSRCCARRST